MMTKASRTSRTGANHGPAIVARDPASIRKSNLRTALVLLAIALTFFFGAIASKYIGGPGVGMSVVGFAVFLFLVFAIGRNLRKGE